MRTLSEHRGFPFGVPALGGIVVAHEEPGVVRQVQQLSNRPEQRVRIAAGEVATRGANIRHEKRVTHEDRIANLIGRVRRCMSGNIQRSRRQAPNRECLVFAKQVVELGAVKAEFRLQIEQLLEDALNGANVLSNRNPAAKLAAQIMRC